jgi:hypothetical protein
VAALKTSSAHIGAAWTGSDRDQRRKLGAGAPAVIVRSRVTDVFARGYFLIHALS